MTDRDQEFEQQPVDFDSIDYDNLMQRRIRNVLLICSSYDAFILEEDGQLEQQLNQDYLELNLSNPPEFIRTSSAGEAFEILDTHPAIDLVIMMYNIGDSDPFELGKKIQQRYPEIPRVLLTHYSTAIHKRIQDEDKSALDHVFYWHGNAELILAIIKVIEDRMNADTDILGIGVQCILLVEDSIRYYSTYLPALYKIILQQSKELLKEALNEQQQKLRKRARPKILFATNYTDAVGLYERYKDHMLGVISDVGFIISKDDPSDSEKLDAGLDLCKLIRADNPLMPFLLQSSQENIREIARQMGVGFVVKYSKTLLLELSEYINREFSFGDFLFTDPQTGEVLGTAKDLREMQHAIEDIPDHVLAYHSENNHLSKWMFARGLFSIAGKLRAVSISYFGSITDLRTYLIRIIKDYRRLLGQGVVARFDLETYNGYIWFARMGQGSLGGKARGLAFINQLLQDYKLYDKYESVRLLIPRTVVVTTDYFDEFIRENGLKYVINSELTDDEILSEFVSSRLPESLIDQLRAFIKTVRRPLAIRSSSKLEDSYYQPFAGVYSTYMIPRTTNQDQMLRLLGKAIKSVYASVYFSASRAYITAINNVLSDEKMAIIIQEVCGTEDQGYFFPTISGVAHSINFYPIGDEKPEDGIANIALGLGKLVVEGGQTLRFSPRHPKNVLQLSTPELTLRDTQREMYALSLRPEEFKTSIDDAVNLRRFEIQKAIHFRNMKYVSSVWDMQNQRISDSPFDEGRKLVTFAHVLKYDTFPLAEILVDLLELGQEAMKCPVELEFAVNLDVPYGHERIFNFLQIRPIVENQDNSSIDWARVDADRALIYAESALGLGLIEGIRDVVYIKPDLFDASHTQRMARQVDQMNSKLKAEGTHYVLVGPGRWGSSDPWLGIPIKWSHISEARVIVECGLKNFRVEPSQGTHFFQNLTSFGAGYLTINPFVGDGSFQVERLDSLPALEETEFVRHVRFDAPLYIFIDGKNNKGIVSEQSPEA
ncbi:MAG: phosphoenolpyruvate synthase [Rikenellaceae bacterium]|nr:phosphoenolpyruvate synthase [Rikenellaceae bacterium]